MNKNVGIRLSSFKIQALNLIMLGFVCVVNEKGMNNSLKIGKMNGVNIKQLIAGFVILFLGVLLYLFDRRPDQIFFIHALRLPSFYNPENQRMFGELGSNLPSFLHVCSFSLLTCALLPSQSRKHFLIVGISWTCVNILFEVGQLITPSTLLNIPHCFFENKIFIYVLRYLRYGTFDSIDIIFAIFGGFIAYCIQFITFKGGKNEIRTTKKN